MRATTGSFPTRHTARRLGVISLAAVFVLSLLPTAAPAQTGGGGTSPLEPVDPQNWVDQADLTWDDYEPVPDRRPEFYDSSSEGTQSQYRTAVILLDFTDQPFLITQEPETHPFGNPLPGWEPVAQDAVSQWFDDYFDEPNELNGFNTMHSYWMETSHGRIGIDVEIFGPYTLPGKVHEYGIPDGGFNAPAAQFCPQGDTCGKNIRGDGGALWRADIGCASGLCGFDNGFYVTAGHDESSTWQEFGEMLWEEPEDIPDEFGPPRNPDGSAPLNQLGQPMPNWSATRYVDWTSWQAAANHWPNASGGTSTQAENSGLSTFAHEFSHLRGLPDNYNNPFADNIRNYTGYWEMMSRGTFNGPGGTHNRWQVPNQGGSALGPHHTLHFKNQLGVLMDDEQVTVTKAQLADEGIARTTVQARSSVPDEGESAGFTVQYGQNVALNSACLAEGNESFWCPPGNTWQHDRLEVVDRVGNDSFVPGHGVLITHSRNSGTPRVWMVDANPEDIGMIDFYRPDGTPVPVVRGDPRQLNDATFHAGTDSGSDFEYVNEAAGVHYYILDTWRDADGVLQYEVAARSLDGAGDHDRDVALDTPQWTILDETTNHLEVALTNTGEAGQGLFASDVYRITSSVEGDGWDTWQPHEVVAAAEDETIPVEVYATSEAGADEAALVTITATSESDPSKSATTQIWVGTAAGLTEVASDMLAGMDLHMGTFNPLRSKLDTAARRWDSGHDHNGCVAIDTFLDTVDRREGVSKGLTSEQADELRWIAASIRVAGGC